MALTSSPSNIAAPPTWSNICANSDVPYCKHVGKNAHNNSKSPPALRGIKIGKIIGVAWRPKGSIVGYSPAMPDVDIPESIRKAPKDAHYYIIDDAWKKPFLRLCEEIDAKAL